MTTKPPAPRVILTYEHLACNTMIDVFLPDPAPGASIASADAMSQRYPQTCPLCRAPMLYVGFGFENLEESD